jgi:DNA polymerase I-like protein with 3'-5' exonuclease and polymerase domains
VREYHNRQEDFVLKHGYVDNAVGQRRRLPLPPEPERSDRFAYKVWMKYKAHVINQAVNYPIQSLAAYVTGSAMVDWEREILRQFNWSYYDFQQAIVAKQWPNMPLQCIEVHDDLVQDIPKGMEAKTKEITHDVMCSVPTLRKLLPGLKVSLRVDTNSGKTWGLKS